MWLFLSEIDRWHSIHVLIVLTNITPSPQSLSHSFSGSDFISCGTLKLVNYFNFQNDIVVGEYVSILSVCCGDVVPERCLFGNFQLFDLKEGERETTNRSWLARKIAKTLEKTNSPEKLLGKTKLKRKPNRKRTAMPTLSPHSLDIFSDFFVFSFAFVLFDVLVREEQKNRIIFARHRSECDWPIDSRHTAHNKWINIWNDSHNFFTGEKKIPSRCCWRWFGHLVRYTDEDH